MRGRACRYVPCPFSQIRNRGDHPPLPPCATLRGSATNCHKRQRKDRIEKTCQHRAVKHPKQSKRVPPTHSSALAVPSYHRILVKHGLIEKTLSIPDAYKVFLKVGADPEATETPSQDRIRRQNETRSRFVSGHSDGSARHDQAGD